MPACKSTANKLFKIFKDGRLFCFKTGRRCITAGNCSAVFSGLQHNSTSLRCSLQAPFKAATRRGMFSVKCREKTAHPIRAPQKVRIQPSSINTSAWNIKERNYEGPGGLVSLKLKRFLSCSLLYTGSLKSMDTAKYFQNGLAHHVDFGKQKCLNFIT